MEVVVKLIKFLFPWIVRREMQLIWIDKVSNNQSAHFLLLGAAFLAIFLDLPADFFLGADFLADDFLAAAFGLAGEALGLAGEALGLGAALLGAALGLEAAFLGAALGLDLDATLFDWIKR